MNNNDGSSKKWKGATVGLVICFVAAIALVGTYTFKHYKDSAAKQLAVAEKEQEKTEEKTAQADTSQSVDSNAIDNPGINESSETENTIIQAPEVMAEDNSVTNAAPQDISFSETDNLIWPVSGSILLNYSMDKTVYFATLDQYKYNPAVVISGEAGEQVVTAARGTVTAVETNAQTGNTVTIDIGSGYQTIYGQLADVNVAVGDYVNAGQAIGNLSEPTKYYSVEGCNLYFELQKDGTPVNPLDYLES